MSKTSPAHPTSPAVLSSAANVLRLAIVDDEPLARARLRSLVAELVQPNCEVMAELATAAQALQWLREQACDVLLLDVQMPGMDGLQLAQALRERAASLGPQPLVIFVTAYALHAVSAFDLQALDYLTKPVRRERLQEALLRAQERLLERAAAQGQALAGLSGASEPGRLGEQAAAYLTVSDRTRLLRIPLHEVLYVRAELKYLTLRTAHASHVMDGTLTELEKQWGTHFLRIHRNALVARWALRELQRHAPSVGLGEADSAADADGAGEGWAVRVAQVNEWLGVSRRQLAAVREVLTAPL